jgi:HSP20 family molecular chaperone IbpA
MTRPTSLSSPLLLGFEAVERALDRVAKGGDSYPPYNVERLAPEPGSPERIRITLAVAGFTMDQLDITLNDKELAIRGRQFDERERIYLYRGIAARQFQRLFVLAEGMDVIGAELENGLLVIDLARPEPQRHIRRIDIAVRGRAQPEEDAL